MREAVAVELSPAGSLAGRTSANSSVSADQAARETIESVIVAVILAFLFRAFVAEAFVIPTGSMAPTLQGRHMDVVCPQCGHQYRTGASVENNELGPPRGEVTRTRCPICRYAMGLSKDHDANHKSFNGDRILVSKFAYQLVQPQRWDVIVFKYPGEAKVNYIKRLIGLPGETIRIRHGDIFVLDRATANESFNPQRFSIARKSPDKVLAMLQLVDDTRYVGQRLRDAQWPSRWRPEPIMKQAEPWRPADQGEGFVVAAGAGDSWLRYRHLIPRADDWYRIGKHEPLQLASYQGQLVTDYYAYNDSYSQLESSDAGGECWVGDLAIECEVAVRSHQGEVLLDLVEGGTHFRCGIEVATGKAMLSLVGSKSKVWDSEASRFGSPAGATGIRGPGTYRLRFANVDDQLFLWVNEQVVEFNAPTTFKSPADVTPWWSEADPGDLSPVGVGARQAELRVVRLRVLRDVYYRAVEPIEPYRNSEYDRQRVGYEFDIPEVLANPHAWSQTRLFAARRSVTFGLAADQYFPLGDNSPESRDARVWSEKRSGSEELVPPPYVSRDLLIGKALLIYWPHAWRAGSDWLPIVPNFQRMGMIR